MMLPLISFQSLHGVLNEVQGDMMALCGHIAGVAQGIAGIGALLYISYRVWQSISRAEPIDIFPLLRPFAIGLCIILFQPLVINGINGLLSPVVTATQKIYAGQNLKVYDMLDEKYAMEKANLSRYMTGEDFTPDAEMEGQLNGLGVPPKNMLIIKGMSDPFMGLGLLSLLRKGFTLLLELFFKAATLVIDTIRTFYLIVLAILGPLSFAVSVFDGFKDSLVQWIARYATVYLWLPVANLFGAILSRLQILSLQKDMELMATDPFYFFDSSNTVYLLFLIIGIVGYFTVPTVASWIVHGSGLGTYNRHLTVVGNYARIKSWKTIKNIGTKIKGK